MPDGRHISDEALAEALDYVLQKHTQASKGGRSHADFRFGNALEGLESYALPKGRLPDSGEKLLAVNTEIHPYGYRLFHGSWGKGRGRNDVEILESGTLNAEDDGTGRLVELQDGRRFKFVKVRRGGKDNWILVGLKPAVKAAGEKDCNFLHGRFVDCRTGQTLANLCIIQTVSAKAFKKGLGGRTNLPFGLGMLFTHSNGFWMKGVPFDLELVRLDGDFRITEIQKMRRSFFDIKLPVYRAKDRRSVHAIEVPAGYCEAKGIKPGDILRAGKA